MKKRCHKWQFTPQNYLLAVLLAVRINNNALDLRETAIGKKTSADQTRGELSTSEVHREKKVVLSNVKKKCAG